MKELDNYIRAQRKQAGLTQKELAFLLCGTTTSTISKLENGDKIPVLRMAITICIVFRTSLRQLFPGIFRDCQYDVIRRLDILLEDIRGEESSRRNLAKVRFLEELMEKIVEDNK